MDKSIARRGCKEETRSNLIVAWIVWLFGELRERGCLTLSKTRGSGACSSEESKEFDGVKVKA